MRRRKNKECVMARNSFSQIILTQSQGINFTQKWTTQKYKNVIPWIVFTSEKNDVCEARKKKVFCIGWSFKESNSSDIIESIGLLSHKSFFCCGQQRRRNIAILFCHRCMAGFYLFILR